MTPDFERDVYCVCGLPLDAVDLEQCASKLRHAAIQRKRCFLSTPNLNFVIAAQSDSTFRDSVLHSDLSVADGMPLVWVARLLRVPLPGRVAGSGLFERLRESSRTPITVYFFGGPDGVAERACARLNAAGSGLRCAGFDSPGFGSVEELSAEDRIARINASGADFVVVSLGARKGQAWIERNRMRLHAPLISHLGAVVNFVAGSVTRAPRWMQQAGLEWLWRIKEEPTLWRRYAGDAVAFARLLLTQSLPLALYLHRLRPTPAQLAAARLRMRHENGELVIDLRGAWAAGNSRPLRTALTTAAVSGANIQIDLSGATYLDSAVIALLALLRAHCMRRGIRWCVQPAPAGVGEVFQYCGARYVLDVSSAAEQG